MTVNIGIIGAGKIVRVRHLPETQMNAHAKIHAICDIVEERAQEMAREYNCKPFTDFRELIAEPELDAVIVAATNTTHAEMAITALKAGKHVLCEKPMATTLVDAQKMIQASEEAGRQLMIAHNQRLEPAALKAREIVQSGQLGKVLSFTSVFGHPGSENWAIDGENTWFYQKEITGLGVLGDLAIHKLDLVRWLLDDDYIEACAFIDTIHKTYPNGNLIDVEDNAVCLLKTGKGALGTVIASWTYQKEDNSTVIYGEKGVLQLYQNPDYPLVVHFDHQNAEYHKLGEKSTNIEQVKSGIIDEFIKALISNSPVPISGKDGYKALEAVIACQQAAETRKAIKIPYGLNP